MTRPSSHWSQLRQDGDEVAWNELVERYAPMVWAICTRYLLSAQDIEDVGQNVWLRLVEHLGFARTRSAAMVAGYHYAT